MSARYAKDCVEYITTPIGTEQRNGIQALVKITHSVKSVYGSLGQVIL